jgi:signal transduction histidine kinase
MPARVGWSAGVGWLTGIAVAAVLAINAAGIVGIAVARRGVVEEAGRALALETESRAHEIVSTLASTQADLTFLSGSPVLFGLEEALASPDPREARWRRLEAEGSFLLFLRGHPEVSRLRAVTREGRPLIEAARRGGVPVLWMSAPRVEVESAPRPAVDPVQQPLVGRFEFAAAPGREPRGVVLEATLDAARVLHPAEGSATGSRVCRLTDGTGKLLAADGIARGGPPDSAAGPDFASGRWIRAESEIAGTGWSAPAPWRLECGRRREAALGGFEPLASRYRTTLLLNGAGMTLALLLGAFAIHQARRRQALEATAREEARVRELERQLFHAERLSTVGRLAAGIAHEINNPLEGMSNYLGLARQDLARGDAESARRRLDAVQEGLGRAVAIVRQVLSHADPATAPMVPLDLAAVVRESVEFVRSRPEFSKIGFELDLADGEMGVRGSAAMLGQVFLNLLLNACEAQPDGGEVRVGARREEGRVVVEFADRGPGVPQGAAGKIFEPFFSTKHSSGLGLSICYSIARRHGAELSVEARPGGGALFRLVFPEALADA